MFKNLLIKNLRGIHHLNIEQLGMVNLFFGDNNCGKSTLLEALFLLSGSSNPTLAYRINFMREYTKLKSEDLALLFHRLNIESGIEISGKSNTEERALQINLHEVLILPSSNIEEDAQLDASNKLTIAYELENTLTITTEKGSTEHTFSAAIAHGENASVKRLLAEDSASDYKEAVYAKYLPPRYQFQVSVEKLKDLKIKGEVDPIVRILQKVEPKIKSLDYIDKDVYVDLGFGALVPINVMGDGIRKLLGVVLSMYECKDGILLVDEIDNGFHYSKLALLWYTLLEASKELNVQLFATTHNKDSLISLSKVMKENSVEGMRDNVAAYKLRRMDNDNIATFRFGADNFEFLIEQGEEIR